MTAWWIRHCEALQTPKQSKQTIKIDCHDLSKGKSRNDKKVVDCFDFLRKSRNDGNEFGLLWRFNESPRNDSVE